MQIKKYGFREEVLVDPLIFFIPSFPELLGTRSIPQIVRDAGLRGFRFENVENLNR